MKQKIKNILKKLPVFKQFSSRWNFVISRLDEMNEGSARLEEKVNQLILQSAQKNIYSIEAETIKTQEVRKVKSDSLTITHFSAHVICNFGDNLLVKAVRKIFSSVNDICAVGWCEKDVRETLSPDIVNDANNTDMLLVGGGGLFLKDTNPNEISGWQWPCSIDLLHQIKKPLIVFAVGYNRFRNQDDFESCFTENINAVVEKSAFFGLRNYGSIRAIQNYLHDDLKNRVKYQPCPTTVLAKLYPEYINKIEKSYIAVNCAFDRSCMRYGERKIEVLSAIASGIAHLSKNHNIKYFVHMESDKEMLPFLDTEQIQYEVVYFNQDLNEEQFIRMYSEPELVIGMRGHAQMIPFGCLTPICSLISHEKMKWFLDDIEHPEWGVDVQDADLENKLYDTVNTILNNKLLVSEQLKTAQEKLWYATQENMYHINKRLNNQELYRNL